MIGWIENAPNGVLLHVHAQPKASRTEIVGPHGEPPRLKIRIAAPPVDGEANGELLRFLKKKLGIPAANLSIIRGESSKSKDILCVAITPEEAFQRLTSRSS